MVACVWDPKEISVVGRREASGRRWKRCEPKGGEEVIVNMKLEAAFNPFPAPEIRGYSRKWKIAPVCPGSLPLTIPVFLPVEGVTGRV